MAEEEKKSKTPDSWKEILKEPRKDKRKAAASYSITNSLFTQQKCTTYKNKHIKEDTLDYIIHSMYDPDANGQNWIMKFVDSQLKEAKRDPNSRAASRIGDALFNENLFNSMEEYMNRKKNEDVDYFRYLVRSQLYDKQQNVYDDNLNKKFLIINSRRSGKTFLMGRLIVKGLFEDDAHVVYINRNSSAAIRQIKQPLLDALAKTNITIDKGSVEAQEIHFSNGSQLLIIGNNNAADIDKLRGERISMCIMDECGHQRNIRQLIREVIDPALKDYGNKARLYMVGTPPRNRGTYVEEIYNNALERGWKLYHWTFLDNPAIPDRDLVISEVCRDNGCTPDSAFIRREYFGEMNAYDEDAKLIKKYAYSPDEILPNTLDYAYVGVDWGYEDKAAVVSVVASKERRQMWIVDCWSEAKKGIDAISDEIERQVENLKKYNLARSPYVICDNNEKGAVADLFSVRHINNVYTAYKYDKDYALDQLNDMFCSNKIVIKKGDAVKEDADNSLWKRDEETDKILHEIDDEVWHPNALMAVLYVSRQFAFEILGWIDHNKEIREIIKR